jgi:hypothetical protein
MLRRNISSDGKRRGHSVRETDMRATLILAAAAAALTSTIGLAKTPETRFSHDGRTYSYTVDDLDGRRVIEGRTLPGNKPFRLVVRGSRVSGSVGGSPVAFRVSDTRGAAKGGTLLAAK